MFTTILTYVLLFSAGAVAGLKVIAPLTATKVDDEILGYIETLEKIAEGLGGKLPEAPVALKA